MAYENRELLPQEPHKLSLENRSGLHLTGVQEVESFDEQMVVVHTTQGTLVVRGRALQLLSLEGGQIRVEGTVESLTYEESLPSAGGFFTRLFG